MEGQQQHGQLKQGQQQEQGKQQGQQQEGQQQGQQLSSQLVSADQQGGGRGEEGMPQEDGGLRSQDRQLPLSAAEYRDVLFPALEQRLRAAIWLTSCIVQVGMHCLFNTGC